MERKEYMKLEKGVRVVEMRVNIVVVMCIIDGIVLILVE